MNRASVLLRTTALLSVAALAAGCGPAGTAAGPSGTTTTTVPSPTSSTTSATSTSTTTTTTGPDTASVRALLDRTKATGPYSAQIDVSLKSGSVAAITETGRINLNGPLTGRMLLKYAPGTKQAETIEIVLTSKQVYARTAKGKAKPKGAWGRVSRSQFGQTLSVPDPVAYARLLLGHGPDVVKGPDAVGGVQAVRLSGQVRTEEVRTIEPGLYDRLRSKSIKGFDLDVWIDTATGRVVRYEQWWSMDSLPLHATTGLSRFAGPVKVGKP